MDRPTMNGHFNIYITNYQRVSNDMIISLLRCLKYLRLAVAGVRKHLFLRESACKHAQWPETQRVFYGI